MASIVFDFDGTLADVKSLLMEVGNEIAVQKGWKPIDESVFQQLSRGSIREGLKTLGIPLRDLPYLVLQGRRKVALRTDEIELFAGIHELITDLHSAGHQLFVLSTNSRKVIEAVLERHNLSDMMEVLPSSGLFGKAPALKRFMRSRKLDKQSVWLIGDELRDIEAAHKAGVKSIAVTWGLQHPDVLKAAQPTLVAGKPIDILHNFQ